MNHTITEWQSICTEMRREIIELSFQAGFIGAHIAPSLSEVEILAVLYLSVLQLQGNDKDHFVLSKGHGGLGLYTALYQANIISHEQLYSFEHNGSLFPGQPVLNKQCGIEYASGSLGMGLSYGTGLALADKRKATKQCTYVLVGDGECDEGSIWESALFSAAHNLDNLIAIVDNNNMQSDGMRNNVLPFDIEAMCKATGWETASVDGHDPMALRQVFDTPHEGKPLVVIAHTIKGKGISFMENNKIWHHNRLSQEDYEKAMKELANE